MRRVPFDALAIFLLVLIIIASLWGVLQHFQQRSEIRNLDPYALIPSDAWLIADIKDPNEITSFFLSDSLAWKELKSLEVMVQFKERLKWLDSISDTDADLRLALEKTRILASVHSSIRGESPVLLQVRFNPELRLSPLERLLEERLEQQARDKVHDFLGTPVYSLEIHGGGLFFAAFYKGSLLISPGKRLIEYAITQEISGSALLAEEALNEIRAVSGSRASNVFFDGQHLCEAIELLYALALHSLVPCEAFSGWMGWDLTLLGDEIRLTGFARSEKGYSSFLNLFSGQEASDPFLMKYIPSASASFSILNFDQASALEDSLARNLTNQGREEFPDSVNRNTLFPFLGDAMASVLLYAPGVEPREAKFSMMHAGDPGRLWEKMLDQEAWETQDETMIPVDTVFDKVIYRLIPEGLIQALNWSMFSSGIQFVSLRDSILLAGTNAQTLKRALMQIHYGQVISNESRLSEDFIFQQPESHLLFMVNIPYLSDMIQPYFEKGVSNLIGEIGEGVFPLGRFTAQFSYHREPLFFSNVSFHSEGAEQTGPHRFLWEMRLDTLAHIRPVCIRNHIDGSTEIFLQDSNRNLYLVDRFGNLLWKRKINGLINSEVYQVDRYNNGKLQILFSTPSHLHLIDRNGNDVEGYPIRMRVSAPQGITVVDYDGNHDYRILFAGADLRIHNVDIEGERVDGWSRPKIDQPAAFSPKYIKLDTRDYLLVVDEKGKPYFFDRRGRMRFTLPGAFRLAPGNPVYSLKKNGQEQLLALGRDGSVVQINGNGTVESFILNTLSAEAGFLLMNPASDENPVYVFTDGPELRAYDRLGKSLFSHVLPGPVSYPPGLSTAGSRLFVSVIDEKNQQLFLFDEMGELVPAFPLPGTRGLCLESLRQDQTWNLITVQNDRLVVYLLGGL